VADWEAITASSAPQNVVVVTRMAHEEGKGQLIGRTKRILVLIPEQPKPQQILRLRHWDSGRWVVFSFAPVID
jgi:hypothetical protein